MTRPWACLALAACGLAHVANAQDIAIYRCTDAQGALTVQNQPCPKGMQQQKKLMQVPRPPPSPAPPPLLSSPAVPSAAAALPDDATAAAAASPQAAAEAIAPPVQKPAPPTLYNCSRRDQTQYLAEALDDAQYCVPMQVVGLDGNPATGAGQACEVIRDSCEPVPDADLCAAWQRRLGEAEDHWRFATPEHAGERQRELARVRDLIAASRCGDGAAAAQKP